MQKQSEESNEEFKRMPVRTGFKPLYNGFMVPRQFGSSSQTEDKK